MTKKKTTKKKPAETCPFYKVAKKCPYVKVAKKKGKKTCPWPKAKCANRK